MPDASSDSRKETSSAAERGRISHPAVDGARGAFMQYSLPTALEPAARVSWCIVAKNEPRRNTVGANAVGLQRHRQILSQSNDCSFERGVASKRGSGEVAPPPEKVTIEPQALQRFQQRRNAQKCSCDIHVNRGLKFCNRPAADRPDRPEPYRRSSVHQPFRLGRGLVKMGEPARFISDVHCNRIVGSIVEARAKVSERPRLERQAPVVHLVQTAVTLRNVRCRRWRRDHDSLSASVGKLLIAAARLLDDLPA